MQNNFWSIIANEEEISGLVLPPKRGYYKATTIMGDTLQIFFNGHYWQHPEFQLQMSIERWYYHPDPANILQIMLEEGE